MKIIKNLGMRKIPRFEKYEYTLYINKEIVEGINVKSTLSHHETYKMLRSFKTPQYDNLYVFRNKHGFTTTLFQQQYDVVIADSSGIVVDIMTEVKPGYISNHYKDSYFIYVCPVGTINFYNIKLRDVLELARKWLK